MEKLLQMLSFRRVAVVEKRRRHYSMPAEWADLGVMIDEVPSLGMFAEIEIARGRIGRLSELIGLQRSEARSYLSLFLEANRR
jgi:adenylate cyclase class IV